MSFEFSTLSKEVLEQVVRDPRVKKLAAIPVFAPLQITLLVLVYGVFFLSSYLYLTEQLPLIAMIAINGIAIYISFTPLHDATHRTVSSNSFINDFLGTIACFPFLPGVTTRIYRYLHLEHHRFSGDVEKDPDEPFVSTHPIFLPFVLAFPDVLWTIWYLKHMFERPITERLEFIAGLSFYVAWHVFWLTSPYAWEFFLIWMIPQRIGMFLVTYFFAHIQHPEEVLWEEAPFQATVFIRTNFFARFVMLGQTIHCLHHLMPNIPFYRYQKAWNVGKNLFEKQNVPVRTLFTPVDNLVLPNKDAPLLIDGVVESITDVGTGLKAFKILPHPSSSVGFPPFEAGAHIDVHIDDGVTRQYSICNDPREVDQYLIAVKKEDEGRGGSLAMHNDFVEGQIIKISAPRNNFDLDLSAEHYVLVAGGIGLTPILSMAHILEAQGKSFSLHICARSLEHVPFYKEILDLSFSEKIKLHLDDGEEGQKFYPEQALGKKGKGKQLYVCGPTGFMEWVIAAAKGNRWSDLAIFSETFVPRKMENLVNRPFTVKLASSGKEFEVKEDEFLIDVLNRNKCGVPCSCTQGICGSCITPVVSGEPEHRDAVLTDEERQSGKKICVCVSRAKGDLLVLDI